MCTTTSSDYEHFFDIIATNYTRKGQITLHLDLLRPDESEIFEELPVLNLFNQIIISTFSRTGKAILFFITPSEFQIDTYCPTLVSFPEINDVATRLHIILQKTFSHEFSLQCRLQVPDAFPNNDPLFMALILAYFLQRRGRYLIITERLGILQSD